MKYILDNLTKEAAISAMNKNGLIVAKLVNGEIFRGIKEAVILPDTEIWYTTEDGKIFSPGGSEIGMKTYISWYTDDNQNATYGGPEILDEVFEDGVWKIKFNADVTHLGFSMDWFDIKESSKYTIYPNFCGGEAGNNIKTVSLPKTVSIIDNSAFMGCEYLEDINIPNGVTEIWSHAFMFTGTENYTTLSIPSTINYLGGYLFAESLIGKLIYAGTKAQFIKIRKDDNWYKSDSSSTPIAINVIHCTDGDLVVNSSGQLEVKQTFNTDDPQYDTFDELFK